MKHSLKSVPALAVLPQSWVIVQTESILWATGKQGLDREKKEKKKQYVKFKFVDIMFSSDDPDNKLCCIF